MCLDSSASTSLHAESSLSYLNPSQKMVEPSSSRPSSSAGRLAATDDKTIIRDREFRLRALAITGTALIARTNLAEVSDVRLLDNAATFATTASLVSKLGKAGQLKAKGDHLRITATSHLVSDPAMPYDTLVKKAKAEGWADVELKQADMLVSLSPDKADSST